MFVDSAVSSSRTVLGFSKKILCSGVDVLMKTMSLCILSKEFAEKVNRLFSTLSR